MGPQSELIPVAVDTESVANAKVYVSAAFVTVEVMSFSFEKLK